MLGLTPPKRIGWLFSMNSFFRLLSCFIVLASLASTQRTEAQQELPPPQGKGRVVVLSSGMSGPEHCTTISREIAQLGYDVVLFDGNTMEGTHGDGVKTAILQAQQMPHALPGKVALVGLSLGGGMSLYYGTQWPDLVSVAVLWYPANSFIHDIPGFVSRLKVPVLVFVGEQDHYRNDCCAAPADRTLAAASTAAGLSFQLITYLDADHDFIKGGDHYNAKDYADAFRRAADRLKRSMAQ
jgi:dienelactone hydrolase